MSQTYGQVKNVDGTTKWKPIEAVLQPDGTYHLAVDTEIALDSANINISNLKVGSVDQTSNTLRYLKVEDDGTLVTVSMPLDSYDVIDTDDGFDESNPGVNYYGYADTDENWYIKEETVTAVGTPNTYRVFKGSGNYATAFANRTGHAYDYYFNIF